MKKNYKIVIFSLLVALIIILDRKFRFSSYLGNSENLEFLMQMVNENIVMALVLYTIFTVVGCVLLALPGVTFAILAGMMLGPYLGIFACLFATTLGASMAFLASRFFLKDSIKPMLEKNALMKKTIFSNDGKSDIVVLMITRMLPIFPYNLQNFAYGITDINFWKYTVLTFVFMFPGVSFFTIGSAGITAEADKWKYFLIAGILAIIVSFAAIFIKKKYIDIHENEI